jgi:hypothetical protein
MHPPSPAGPTSAQLLNFLTANSIMIACIQETKLSARSKQPNFPDYAFVRCDHTVSGGGGLAILIHHSIPYINLDVTTLTNQNPTLEVLAVCIEIGGSKLDILNVYAPPILSCLVSHRPNFNSLLNFPFNNSLFLGNFNAYHTFCFSPWDPSDPRGDLLATAIKNSNHCTLNLDSQTRQLFNNFPTLLKIADWKGFISESENSFSHCTSPTFCAKGEKIFMEVLLKATWHNIL